MAKGFLLALLLCLVLCGCSGSSSHPVTLVTISVTPATATIAPGTTTQFKATGSFSDGSSTDLTASAVWTSNSATATVSNASGSQGLATAVSPGLATITATSGQVSGSATLTTAAVQSITVNPANPVGIAGSNQTIQFTARALGSGLNQDVTSFVTWSSSNGASATITPQGVATVGNAGSAIITATLGAASGPTTLTVATLIAIDLAPANPTLALGITSQQFVATGRLSNGTQTDVTKLVTWSSANPSIVSITAAGVASALAVGNTSISASFQGVTQSTPVTVAGPTSITVSPASAKVFSGSPQQFTARGFFPDGSSQDLTSLVSWSSSATNVATVSPQGLATAVANGTAFITATLTATSVSGRAQLTVQTLSAIAIAPVNQTVRLGTSLQLAATGTFADGSSQDITNLINWNSSAPAIVSVSNTAGSKGLVTGQAIGSSVITASFGSVSNSTGVTVAQTVVTPASEAFVANFNSGVLSIIDTGQNVLLPQSVQVGGGPIGVAVNPVTNLAYVTNSTSANLSVVDLTKNTLVTTIPTSGAGPWGVAVSPTTNKVYVSNNQGNSVSVIDVTPNVATSNTVIATVLLPSGSAPKGLALNPASNRLYVANFGSNSVSVIDTVKNTLLATFSVGSGPVDVAVNPQTSLLYVANNGINVVSVITVSNDLDQLLSSIPVGIGAQRVAINPAASLLYVTVINSGLAVVDLTGNALLTTIPVGNNPQGVAVKPSANRIYVANFGSNSVSVINSLTNTVIATISGFVQPNGVATYP